MKVSEIAEKNGLDEKSLRNFTQRFPVEPSGNLGRADTYAEPEARLIAMAYRLSRSLGRRDVCAFMGHMRGKTEWLYFQHFEWTTPGGLTVVIPVELWTEGLFKGDSE
jgi:hypothetical protein